MRRIAGILAIILVFTAVLAGCGKKDAGSIVRDLDRTVNKMDSYQGSGKMILHTGVDPQEYQVEVWFKAPHYYRISLTNAKKDITQIVLRNDEGVFVLTPHLNKSFRFQSDWPENQGQIYLYQSLVQSIVADNDRQFTTDGDTYVFDVLGNYQNASLARQKVWLAKKDYAPRHIEVADANGNTMVVFDFAEFKFDKSFDKDSFDMQRNMTSWNMKSMPTSGTAAGDGQAAVKAGDKSAAGTTGTDAKAGAGKTADSGKAVEKGRAAETGKAANAGKNTATGKSSDTNKSQQNGKSAASAGGAAAAQAESFGVIEPSYTPKGVQHQDISDVKLGENKGVLLRYNGEYNYSLLETRPADQEAAAMKGSMVDLGYTFALLTGDEHKTMIWTYDGIEYRLSTDDLPTEEMISIAQSVQSQIGK